MARFFMSFVTNSMRSREQCLTICRLATSAAVLRGYPAPNAACSAALPRAERQDSALFAGNTRGRYGARGFERQATKNPAVVLTGRVVLREREWVSCASYGECPCPILKKMYSSMLFGPSVTGGCATLSRIFCFILLSYSPRATRYNPLMSAMMACASAAVSPLARFTLGTPISLRNCDRGSATCGFCWRRNA